MVPDDTFSIGPGSGYETRGDSGPKSFGKVGKRRLAI